jgi:hypothetical protein
MANRRRARLRANEIMAATADMIAEFGCSLQKNTMPSILPMSELNLAIRAVAYPAKSRNDRWHAWLAADNLFT